MSGLLLICGGTAASRRAWWGMNEKQHKCLAKKVFPNRVGLWEKCIPAPCRRHFNPWTFLLDLLFSLFTFALHSFPALSHSSSLTPPLSHLSFPIAPLPLPHSTPPWSPTTAPWLPEGSSSHHSSSPTRSHSKSLLARKMADTGEQLFAHTVTPSAPEVSPQPGPSPLPL